MASTRVLLRQVLFNHGQHVPSFPMGCMSNWVPLLPNEEVDNALDRCTVVLPRPGDGWYAIPGSSGKYGFPWGQLSAKGAQEMHLTGQVLARGESRPRGAARDVDEAAISRPARRSMENVTVRSMNLQRNIMSAQGIINGAQQAFREDSQKRQWPVEVLLQRSEDLTVQTAPSMADYPTLNEDMAARVQGMMQPMTEQLMQVASCLDTYGPDLTALAQDNFDEACDALMCLEAQGLVEPLGPAMQEKVSALKRFQFSRWVSPIHAGGAEAAVRVVGPLLDELFRACEAAADDPAEPDVPVPLMLYMLHAEPLMCALASLGLAGAERTSTRWDKLTWPKFGSSLEVVLVKDKEDELFLQLIQDGDVYVPGLGRDILPYAMIRVRFGDL